jgi:alpha-N-acetylglucosamine transferase
MSRTQLQRRYFYVLLAILLVSFTSLFFYFLTHSLLPETVKLPHFSNTLPLFSGKMETPRYAYATFLSTRVHNDTEHDPYFTATRVLAYQLLHRPSTRTKLGLPFLVIVPPHVSKRKQRILAEEGATIIPVALLNPTHWTASPSQPRWVDQFTKLRLFELTQYDRILYMDTDMLLTRPLDAIFDEPEVAKPYWTKNDSQAIQQREALMPQQYVLAGVTDNEGPGNTHSATVKPGSRLNGGFFVLQPSRTLFEYYESLLETEGRFDSSFMEMALLNYAHRHDGPMPCLWCQEGGAAIGLR